MAALDGVYLGRPFLFGGRSWRVSPESACRRFQGSPDVDGNMVFSVPVVFAWGLNNFRGQQEALEFVTGYIVELSLSMDNVFVIALICCVPFILFWPAPWGIFVS